MLAAVGKAEGEIAQAEQKFINSTKDTVLRPFYSFVDNDAKTIFKVEFFVNNFLLGDNSNGTWEMKNEFEIRGTDTVYMFY